jgi:hypothetical protein
VVSVSEDGSSRTSRLLENHSAQLFRRCRGASPSQHDSPWAVLLEGFVVAAVRRLINMTTGVVFIDLQAKKQPFRNPGRAVLNKKVAS